jgi:hypothetical protein
VVDLLSDTVTIYHYRRNPNGEAMTNTNDASIRDEFARGVTEYLNKKMDESQSENIWNSNSDLKEIAAIMDYVVTQAAKSRAILKNQR